MLILTAFAISNVKGFILYSTKSSGSTINLCLVTSVAMTFNLLSPFSYISLKYFLPFNSNFSVKKFSI